LREIFVHLISYKVPTTRISKDFQLSRASVYRILNSISVRDPLKDEITDIALDNPSFGYRRIHALLRQKGIHVNHKKVYRIYTQLDLQRPANISKKIHLNRSSHHLTQPEFPGHVWSADFIERMVRGRKFRVFVIIDDYTRRIMGYHLAFSITGQKVLDVFENSIATYSRPRVFRTDNGPEFKYNHLNLFLSNGRIKHEFIQVGRPYQNPFSEGFNSRFSDECLKRYDFSLMPVEEITSVITKWLEWYNYQRPHSAINYEVPVRYHIRAY